MEHTPTQNTIGDLGGSDPSPILSKFKENKILIIIIIIIINTKHTKNNNIFLNLM